MNIRRILTVLACGIFLAGSIAWMLANARARRNCAFFLEGLATSEIHSQEAATSEAYLTEDPICARWALESLLKTYSRYAEIPTSRPTEWASRLRNATALTHARLAYTYEKLNEPAKRAEHISVAMNLLGIENEQDVRDRVDELDRAEEQFMSQQGH